MPTLTNPRHERFAQGLFEGLSATAAYEKAGYRHNRANAVRLKAKDDIQSRLTELHEAAVEAAGVTIEGHLARLADLRDRAEADESWGAAVRAKELRGKASGFYVTRTLDVGSGVRPEVVAKQVADMLGLDENHVRDRMGLGPVNGANGGG